MSSQKNNNALLAAFRGLGILEKSQLRSQFAQSPIALRLFDFLNDCKDDFLSMPKVINHVYANEKLAGVDEGTLTNRFFKLRQKLMAAIKQQHIPKDLAIGDFSFPQERELVRIREMLAQNRITDAAEQLAVLEKECWELNLFEFLPEVLDHLVFCSHALLKPDQAAHYLKMLKKAHDLLGVLNQCKLLARHIFDYTYNKGTKHALPDLKKLSDIAGKHKAYPRFQLGYHHLSVYIKLADPQWLTQKQVINRHLNIQQKLVRQYPRLPIFIIRPHYEIYQQFILLQTQVMIAFSELDFETGANTYEHMYQLIAANPVLNIYRTVQLYNNLLTVLIAARRISRAEQILVEFEKMLKHNQWTKDNQTVILFLKVWIATEPHAHRTHEELAYLLTAMGKVIAKRVKANDTGTSTVRLYLFQFRLLYRLGRLEKAKGILKNPAVQQWLQANHLRDLFDGLVNDQLSNSDLKKQLSKVKYSAIAPDIFIIARWVDDMAKQL